MAQKLVAADLAGNFSQSVLGEAQVFGGQFHLDMTLQARARGTDSLQGFGQGGDMAGSSGEALLQGGRATGLID